MNESHDQWVVDQLQEAIQILQRLKGHFEMHILDGSDSERNGDVRASGDLSRARKILSNIEEEIYS